MRQGDKRLTKYIVDELDEKPFSPNGPLNVAVLDAIFVALAASWPSKPHNFKNKVKRLIADAKFQDLYSSRTADTDIVRRRLKMAADALA